jgi:hypothetical protein
MDMQVSPFYPDKDSFGYIAGTDTVGYIWLLENGLKPSLSCLCITAPIDGRFFSLPWISHEQAL